MDASGFTWDEHFWTNTVAHPIFGNLVAVILPEENRQPPTDRQIAAVTVAVDCPDSLRSAVDDAALAYCNQVCEYVDLEEELGIAPITADNVSRHYRIAELVIPRLKSSKRHFYFLTGDCDWEPEHGIEILLEDHAIQRCGQQDCLYLNEEWNEFIVPQA